MTEEFKHIVSWSEIQSFRACPHKWSLAYKNRWVAPTTSPALVRGTLFHACMEEYHAAIRKLQKNKLSADDFPAYVNKALAPLLYQPDGTQSEVQELVNWMVSGYIEHNKNDAAEWDIIATEHDAVIRLPNEKLGPSEFGLKMKIDLLARHKASKKLYIWDHKTCRNLPTNKELAFDDQFGLYTWGMRQLGKKVWGCWYDAVRTQKNVDQSKQTLESRHLRIPMYRTDKELDNIAVEAYLTVKRAYAIPDGMEERTPDTERCRFMCSYTESCLLGRKGGDEHAFMEATGFQQIFTRH